MARSREDVSRHAFHSRRVCNAVVWSRESQLMRDLQTWANCTPRTLIRLGRRNNARHSHSSKAYSSPLTRAIRTDQLTFDGSVIPGLKVTIVEVCSHISVPIRSDVPMLFA